MIPRSGWRSRRLTVNQQGQVSKLKARGADGRPLWAFRHRLDGRGSARPQVGGFASRAEAEEALRKALARLRPGGCAATMTLAELVDEYLGMHSGRAGDDREAALAARQGDKNARRGEAGRAVGEGDLRLAADDPGRAPLRGDTGGPAGPEPRGAVGVAQRQPREAGPELAAAALEREAALRDVAADRGRRRAARPGVRADGDLRRRNWAAAVGAVRTRASRRRS